MMEEKLKEIFSYVNYWTNFAEVKNGALVAINGGCIIGILNVLLGTDYCINNWLRIYLMVALGLLILATGIALLSFLPMIGKFKDYGINDCSDSILLYFGDIAKCKNTRQYVVSVYRDYLNEVKKEEDISKLEDDYAKEIIYNAKVTMRKYKCFKIALLLTISAFVSLPGVLLTYIIIWFYNKINEI